MKNKKKYIYTKFKNSKCDNLVVKWCKGKIWWVILANIGSKSHRMRSDKGQFMVLGGVLIQGRSSEIQIIIITYQAACWDKAREWRPGAGFMNRRSSGTPT